MKYRLREIDPEKNFAKNCVKGLQVLSRPWVLERTFGWLNNSLE